MTTKEASVTIALSSPTPMVSVALDEQPDVFGDALVGIVGGVAEQLHAVVVGPSSQWPRYASSSSAASGSAATG